jgi:hypothetical protein
VTGIQGSAGYLAAEGSCTTDDQNVHEGLAKAG